MQWVYVGGLTTWLILYQTNFIELSKYASYAASACLVRVLAVVIALY